MATYKGRRSIRLPGYDYRQAGGYFVTICTANRECHLGHIQEESVTLSVVGQIVAACWRGLPSHFHQVTLDEFVIMPNHLHGILVLEAAVAAEEDSWEQTPQREGLNGTRAGSLSAVLQNFKAVSTRRVNHLNGTRGHPLWQRNFYERIIRDDKELDRIRRYIIENPARWSNESENPER